MPVFHGVSAMGTRLCFYSKFHDEDAVYPPQISVTPETTDAAPPPERWNCDILEDEGEERFRCVVGAIKRAVASL